MTTVNTAPLRSLRVLVAIASYGTSNDRYLEQLVCEYRSMPFTVDLLIVSNIEKKPACDIECLVGLPNKNPWSLPFSHKKLFAERADQYDLFIYSEDDILITERNLMSFLDATAVLHDDEVIGFLRIEKGVDGEVNYPDVHAYFHWDPTSVRSRGRYTLANFTNEHAACYVLTRAQLAKAVASGGFTVEPHEGKYDLLCSAATDPYTQCGLTKLIPISHLDDFTVHHLSNKYVHSVGIREHALREQINALLRIATDREAPAPLFNTETKLWRCMYSKEYYEPVSEQAISMIPDTVRSVLSIGCGWGGIEHRLAGSGLRVVAAPLDPVIASLAATRDVEMVFGDFRAVLEKIGSERFDCILYQNVLHLTPDPVELLSLFRGVLSSEAVVIIQTPNMLCIPAIWGGLRNPRRPYHPGNYHATGVHFTFAGKVREWCRHAGLTLDAMVPILHRRAEPARSFMRGLIGISMAPELIVVARNTDQNGSSRPARRHR